MRDVRFSIRVQQRQQVVELWAYIGGASCEEEALDAGLSMVIADNTRLAWVRRRFGRAPRNRTLHVSYKKARVDDEQFSVLRAGREPLGIK